MNNWPNQQLVPKASSNLVEVTAAGSVSRHSKLLYGLAVTVSGMLTAAAARQARRVPRPCQSRFCRVPASIWLDKGGVGSIGQISIPVGRVWGCVA